MRKLAFLLLGICFGTVAFAQVAIGTTTPDASAKFQIDATDKGFLAPRVALTSLTDNTTIASPATGLMVYCNGTGGLEEGFYYWNGSSWTKMSQVSNNQDLGYVVGWPSNATPPGYLLPLSGGTYNWADYPEFQTFNGTYASQFIASSNATTFTLKDINGTGRFLRGGNTAGTDQAGSTKLPVIPFAISTAGAHTHSVDPAAVTSGSAGAHSHTIPIAFVAPIYGWGITGGVSGFTGSGNTSTTTSGDHNHSVDIPATTSSSNGDHNHTISGGDAETRPINTTIVWCIKVKPTAAAGNITINNVDGITTATNGLTATPSEVKLGGTLLENTTIDKAGFDLNFTGAGNVEILGNAAVGTTTPVASARLQVDATSQGVLLPRLTQTQMNAIASPATGLLLFCTDCTPVGFRFYNGTVWSELMPVKQVALYNSSVYTNANSNIVWGDVRYNAVSSANMVWSAGNTTCTLSNGKYLVEWGITRVTDQFSGIDFYLNSAQYRGSVYYSRVENGGNANWGGNTRRYAVIDATSSSQVLLFKSDFGWGLNVGAELKIEKLD
jgi:hypothetical protein